MVFGENLLHQLVAGVDVLDRELPALELVLALHRIGAGARHRDATVTELPYEPAGQVPIAGWSPTAKARRVNPCGNKAPPAGRRRLQKLRRESVPALSVRDIFISSR